MKALSEGTLKIKTEALGGTLAMPDRIVMLPKTLRIKTKSEAIDLIDILQDADTNFHGGSWDTAYNTLKTAIKRGLDK